MGCQIPNHVDVVLKKTQVYTQRIVVIKIAESSFINELSNFLDSTGKKKSMVYHNLQVFAVREFDQLFGPHRPAVAGRESSEQRLRAIARNRSPPPAHIGKQGQGDAHVASLEARPIADLHAEVARLRPKNARPPLRLELTPGRPARRP